MELLEEEFQIDVGSTGVAVEEDSSGDSQAPFDLAKTRVTRDSSSLDLLISRIKYDDLDLSPNFQRKTNLWTNGAQSRLIESLLIRIPIPAFYFDASKEKWLVVDGVQRLTALARFIIDEQRLNARLNLPKLKLCELEFLTDLNGKTFDDLEPIYQRRILETQVTLYKIDPGTPLDVKYNIFKRINTGGLPLSRQEIRNALNAGQATDLLDELVHSKEFLDATNHSILGLRGEDHECVLRFIAFTLSPYKAYNRTRGFHQFLNDTMNRINKMSPDELETLKKKFKKAMDAAHRIFGQAAFRRTYHGTYYGPIYRTLFEVWSVHLGRLCEDSNIISNLVEKKHYITHQFRHLLMDRGFGAAISSTSSTNIDDVTFRFEKVGKFIDEVLKIRYPWENILEKYPIGTTVRGSVVRIYNMDTLIELEKGVSGLIPASELSWTKRYPNPRQFFDIGDEIDVVVLDIDPEEQRFILSHKHTELDPWEDASKNYSVGSVVRGRIVKIVHYGAFAKLKDGIEGLIHISEFPQDTERVEDIVAVGEEFDLKIIRLDEGARRVSLSLRNMHGKGQTTNELATRSAKITG